MIINDKKILDCIYTENDVLSDFDELDLNDPLILDELLKIKNIRIVFKSKDEPESTLKQLNEVLKLCTNLDLVYILSFNPETKNININHLIDIAISHNVKRINISGFSYDYLSLSKNILSFDNETMIYLDRVDSETNDYNYIFSEEKLRKQLRFNKHASDELGKLYSELFHGKISLENYIKFKDYLINYKDLYITIGNVSDLDLIALEKIKKDNKIKGIYLLCGYNDTDKAQRYTVEEYEAIRKKIDNIIKMVKLPKDNEPNREKLIFAQLYQILGKNIKYDHYAICDEGKNNEQLSRDCRNLKNGLLGVTRNGKKELLTVCAGYATILQNLCACFNIRCDYISSLSKEVEIPGVFTLSGPRKYENGTTDPQSHAYNAVYLDGKPYLCDLTWDADNMKLDNLGNHFLKSYEEFYISHKNQGFSSDNVKIITQEGQVVYSLDSSIFVNSCSIQEQIELFGKSAKSNIEEMISEGYLADFVMKNIEFIKQVKGKVELLEYLKLIKKIHCIEEYIKSPEFKARAGWAAQAISSQIINPEKDFVFYPGSRELSPNEAINEVINMEEKQWKMR